MQNSDELDRQLDFLRTHLQEVCSVLSAAPPSSERNELREEIERLLVRLEDVLRRQSSSMSALEVVERLRPIDRGMDRVQQPWTEIREGCGSAADAAVRGTADVFHGWRQRGAEI